MGSDAEGVQPYGEREGATTSDPLEAIKTSYQKEVYDEEFEPTVIVGPSTSSTGSPQAGSGRGTPVGLVQENDAVIFF